MFRVAGHPAGIRHRPDRSEMDSAVGYCAFGTLASHDTIEISTNPDSVRMK
jgi:hypothetical protein